MGGTPSAGVSLWDAELEGSLAASPSAAGRSWDVPLVASLLLASLSLDGTCSGGGCLAASAFVASLLACGGFFSGPTVMMVHFLFSK